MNDERPNPDDVRYRKLDTIDGKCGSLLAVTSILLVFISLPPIFDAARAAHALAFKFVFITLLTSCLLALFVLFFKEDASDRFVETRKYALNTAVCLTAACCVVVALFVGARF
ncbi:MAG TPA: hypothetical protein VLW52_03700 [Opitutaceae bacterium]|nr:hypothetical protein [Opitutaceae bacterium]